MYFWSICTPRFWCLDVKWKRNLHIISRAFPNLKPVNRSLPPTIFLQHYKSSTPLIWHYFISMDSKSFSNYYYIPSVMSYPHDLIMPLNCFFVPILAQITCKTMSSIQLSVILGSTAHLWTFWLWRALMGLIQYNSYIHFLFSHNGQQRRGPIKTLYESRCW